jgi:ankyrin repeat protein
MNANPEALLAAIAAGDPEQARALLKSEPTLASGRTVNGVSLVLWAMYHRQRDIAWLIADSKEPLDIFELAALGRVDELQRNLAADSTCVRMLASDGFSPLGLAIFFGQVRAAAALLAAGAEVDRAADNPMRVAPIHSACAQADEALACRLVHLLLAFSVNLDARQQAGWTALHAAAHRNYADLVGLLRSAGADPQLRNDAGLDAVDIARSEGKEAALAALLA